MEQGENRILPGTTMNDRSRTDANLFIGEVGAIMMTFGDFGRRGQSSLAHHLQNNFQVRRQSEANIHT